MSVSIWTTILTLLVVAHGSQALNDNSRNGNGKGKAVNAAFQPIFQTEDMVRQNKARDMRRHMNLSADPCADFYEYACGNWGTATPPALQMKARVDADLLRLLDDSVHRGDSALARQAKEFYKSCLNAQARQSQQQQDFLSEFIQQHGGFPAVPGSNWEVHHHNYDWVEVLGQLRRYYGMDILIGLRVGYNYANVHENSIYLTEPSTLIPAELCSIAGTKRVDIRDGEYEAIEQLVAAQLKAWLALGNTEAKRLAADLVTFEYELCGSMQGQQPWDAELRLYETNYTRKTLAELTQLYGQKLDFNKYVTGSYGQSVYKPVFMAAPGYYRQLLRTVSSYNVSQLANYIMYRALATLTLPLDDQPQRRPGYCLALLKRQLPGALGEIYARQYASEEAKRELLQLYAQLQDALQQSLQAEWLEEGTRRVAERKLKDLTLLLPAYEQPGAVYSLQLERSNYWHNLRQLLAAVQAQEQQRLFDNSPPQPSDAVEAYELRLRYRAVQRRIDLGWALLQPPDYDPRYGQAVRYATLGQRLAQQLALAFDDLHWSVGLLERDNWDGMTAWAYHNRSDCFARQVADYLHANASAVEQLIGRSAGLNVAFRAYLTWLGFQEPHNEFTRLTKETLPGLNFSNTALFFLAYAQQHCRWEPRGAGDRLTQEPLPTYSANQKHSWTRLAVNGPLRNLAEFSREFHCSAGAPMNPADKCVIY